MGGVSRDMLRGRWLQGLMGVIGIAVIGVVFFVVLPGVADYGDVWAATKTLSWLWLLALAAATIANVLTFAPPWMVALPGLSFRPALTVTLTATASTYMAPGGPAVGMTLSFAMLSAWGFARRAVTIAVGAVTVWNQFVIFGTPAIALWLLTRQGEDQPLLRTAALAGLAIFGAIVIGFGLALTSARMADRLGDFAATAVSAALKLVRRGAVGWGGASFVRFRHDTIGLLRARWHALTAATILGHGTVFLVLIVALRAFGVDGSEVSLTEAFAAWALVRVLGAIPITPGGFGVVELGLTGALIGFGGNSAEVVAVVLLYRFLTVGPPLVLGVLLGATWRRHHPRWQDGAPPARA